MVKCGRGVGFREERVQEQSDVCARALVKSIKSCLGLVALGCPFGDTCA